MTATDQQIRDSLHAARDRMTLLQPEDVALYRIHQRAAGTQVRRARRRWVLPVGAAAIVGVGASVAVAVTVANDGSSDAFRGLHPDKAQIGATNEEPHALLGNLPADGGGTLRAYVTTKPGTTVCVFVESLTPSGAQTDSISYCGNEPATQADLRLVNGVLIGWVPDQSVTSVHITGNGYSKTAQVVARHFVAPAAPTGSTETIRGLNAASHVNAVWTVPVQ